MLALASCLRVNLFPVSWVTCSEVCLSVLRSKIRVVFFVVSMLKNRVGEVLEVVPPMWSRPKIKALANPCEHFSFFAIFLVKIEVIISFFSIMDGSFVLIFDISEKGISIYCFLSVYQQKARTIQ